MRNEAISGFILHQRPYRETSRLVYFFSKEHGVLHGVMRGVAGSKAKLLPRQFQAYTAFAHGKGSLKRFSHMEATGIMPQLHGQCLYAGMYANELLMKLLATEDVMHHTFYAYADTLLALANISPHSPQALADIKLALRRLELNLLGEMGYGINFQHDKNGNPFNAALNYSYTPEVGFTVYAKGNVAGSWLQSFDQTNISSQDVNHLGSIFRQSIDALLEYKPLKSRELWAELYAKKHDMLKNDGR